MSKNKIVAICLIAFQVIILISLAAVQRLGAVLYGLFFCSFGIIGALLLALDTKEKNRSIASGVLLILFGLLILIGSIGAMTSTAFNGWYVAFLIGALVMMAVGGWILYNRNLAEETDAEIEDDDLIKNIENKDNNEEEEYSTRFLAKFIIQMLCVFASLILFIVTITGAFINLTEGAKIALSVVLGFVFLISTLCFIFTIKNRYNQ